MTLGEFKAVWRTEGGLYLNSELERNPFFLEDIARRGANEIAQRTDCYMQRRYLDLQEGVYEYCAPDIYKPKRVLVLNEQGNWEEPALLKNYEQRTTIQRNRTTSAYTPDTVSFFGVNRISVYPPPSETRNNALLVEGFCVPGATWEFYQDGSPKPLADEDECPLPPGSAQTALEYYGLWRIALFTKSPAAPIYMADYDRHRGMTEVQVALQPDSAMPARGSEMGLEYV